MPERVGFGPLQETQTDVFSNTIDLFTPEHVEFGIKERKSFVVNPLQSLDSGPYSFRIQSSGNGFFDPSSLRTKIHMRIKKKNDTGDIVALTEADNTKVFPVNLLSKSIIKDVSVWMNHVPVSVNSLKTYGMRCYIANLLTYGVDAEKGLLKINYWEKDTIGKMDSLTENTKGLARHAYIAKSKLVKIYDNVQTELTTCPRLILPTTEILLTFDMEDTKKFLMHPVGDTYVMEIEHFSLSYDRVYLHDQIHDKIERQLSVKSPAIYPITKTEHRSKSFAPGVLSMNWPQMYYGNVPESVVVCFTAEEAHDGMPTKNMYNFQNFSVTKLQLSVESQQFPLYPLEFDFTNEDAIEGYKHLLDNSGIDITNAPSLITYDEFQKGSFIVPFDLTPDKCSLYHAHKKHTGNLSLKVELGTKLTEGVTLHFFAVYRDTIYIHGKMGEREVITNVSYNTV